MTRRFRGGPERALIRAVALTVALATAGCGIFDREPPPPCPPVLVVKDAAKTTVYRDGPGRDVTDVVFSAQIVDFRGECEWNRARTEVDTQLRILFEIERGPANVDRKASFGYFLAIPAFYPAPEGKRVFQHDAVFPGNITRMRSGDTVRVKIPIPRNKRWDDFPAYIGIQLSPAQAEQNRPTG